MPDVCVAFPDDWTDPATKFNWLRDFLPKDVTVGRVVAYSYEATVASLFANDAPARVQRMAETFLQELRADRKFAGTLRRPIVFICHGFGGVLVKKSLIYSSTRTAPRIVHLWDQFVSTFAILFFGTPHGISNMSAWMALENQLSGKPASGIRAASVILRPSDDTVQISQTVDTEFGSHLKQFHMFFFWEKFPTHFGSRTDFVVNSDSAVPKVDNTETAGISAKHAEMVRFGSRSSTDYRTVLAALDIYCEKAPQIILHRWRQADAALKQMRAGEVWELGGLGFDVHLEEPYQPKLEQKAPAQNHFYPPRATTTCFVGREDKLDVISEAFFPVELSDKRPARKSFVVFGIGGSGKTELCSKYAEDFTNRYHAVFTIRAGSKEMITNSFGRIGEIAGLEPTEAAGRHFLSQLHEPWLLIIDNADDPLLDLQDLVPQGTAAHTLITTRCPDFRKMGTLGFMELQGLNEEEALRLLLTSADIHIPWDESTRSVANFITKSLGYLAIAVIQAGNCIFRGVCKLSEYMSLYSEERETLQSKRRSPNIGADETEDQSLVQKTYSTFDISLKILLERPSLRRQDAAELLKVLAFFHFENIPIEVLSRAARNSLKSLEAQSSSSTAKSIINAFVKRLQPPKLLPNFLKADGKKLDRYRINWAIGELRSLSLIGFDGHYISLHPLVQAWARDSLPVPERKVWASIALNTLLEAVSLPGGGSGESDGEFHRDILPHLQVCLAGSEGVISTPTTPLGKFLLQVAKVFQPTRLLIMGDHVQREAKCGWVFAERGLFDQASFYLENVKDTLMQILGQQHEKTMSAMLGLAGVYWGLGRLDEAISLQRNVVDIRSRLFGNTAVPTLQAMNQLGSSYWLNGMYVEALELQQTTSERMKAVIDKKHGNYPDMLSALDNLGVTLGAWRRYQESLEIHQEVLEARTQLLGDTHADTLTTKANLAMALLDLGRLEEAKAHLNTVYFERQHQLGKEHPWTLWTLCYRAKADNELGLLDEAEKMLTWGVKAGERSLTKNHLGVLMGRGELARTYSRQGKVREAKSIMTETLPLLEETRGATHPDFIFGLWKLAQLYVIGDERSRAIQTVILALRRAETRLATHPMRRDLEHMLEVLRNPLASKSELEGLLPRKYGTSSRQPETVSWPAKDQLDHPPVRAPTW